MPRGEAAPGAASASQDPYSKREVEAGSLIKKRENPTINFCAHAHPAFVWSIAPPAGRSNEAQSREPSLSRFGLRMVSTSLSRSRRRTFLTWPTPHTNPLPKPSRPRRSTAACISSHASEAVPGPAPTADQSLRFLMTMRLLRPAFVLLAVILVTPLAAAPPEGRPQPSASLVT
jgi:hypothetical protein